MPVKIPNNLPARTVLENENIFVMTETRAVHQDIRPLRIIILNLMPTKIATETQLLRRLSNSPLQVDVTLVHMEAHESKNTPPEHLMTFYNTFDQIRSQKFDGLVITGAPVEQMPFEAVDYWEDLKEIMDWSRDHILSTLYICWGAQAGLFHFYGIPKYPLEKKMFGVFPHCVLDRDEKIMRGFDDVFYAPHSRHTEVRAEDIEKVADLKLLAVSKEAGVYAAASRDGRHIFITGHSEYDPLTLKAEYDRDVNKGLPIEKPRNYFPGDDPEKTPVVRWRSHSNLLFANWLNYYVYQVTPYDLDVIPQHPLFDE